MCTFLGIIIGGGGHFTGVAVPDGIRRIRETKDAFGQDRDKDSNWKRNFELEQTCSRRSQISKT